MLLQLLSPSTTVFTVKNYLLGIYNNIFFQGKGFLGNGEKSKLNPIPNKKDEVDVSVFTLK